jgi:hypothetical protein
MPVASFNYFRNSKAHAQIILDKKYVSFPLQIMLETVQAPISLQQVTIGRKACRSSPKVFVIVARFQPKLEYAVK